MLAALASGQLIRDPKSGTSQNGHKWANGLVRVPCGQSKEGDQEAAFLTVVCFGDQADKLARMSKGDNIAAQGQLKPTSYEKDGETRHGMELMAQSVLSPYDLRKKRGSDGRDDPKPARQTQPASHQPGFDDEITF